ncbi:MAG TPA: amylo-alpha-1,6-glucosidase [Prolixibacteraceae bacterium]|nr:amylo-alpha-1,6-glucosidase [Prolixibacteraceae bacterium]
MNYLKFDKNQLVNLEYSLQREILRSNRAGSYTSTSLSGCNTRKYHGLLICPLDELEGEKHVLLSSLDETIVQHESSFNLGIHKYEGDHYEPKGHKYILDFDAKITPKTTYRVGGVVLSKEQILVEKEQQLLIRYTLEDAHSPTILRFRPFLAFRSIHRLSKANLFVNTRYTEIGNGIKVKLYDGYPFLNMQFSKEVEFIPAPDWNYGIEYLKEQDRGYDFKEDLFVPGYFELSIKKGESIIFSASTNESISGTFKQKFTREVKKRIPRDSFVGSLSNAAQQFFVRKEHQTNIIAGFPWYGRITRQSFIALPGLTLDLNDEESFEKVIATLLKSLNNGLFLKFPGSPGSSYDSIDAPLWFFWTIQQYYRQTKNSGKIWKKYGLEMKSILSAYKNGTDFNIRMLGNGLISGKTEQVALTWMDSYLNGNPVLQRGGMPVEVNALWYNALCLSLELAEAENDQEFLAEWKDLPALVARSFVDLYWSEERQYLADCIDGENKDWSIRPNMVIAAALEFTPLDREKQKAVLSTVKQELLTPRGLRTLSPGDPHYKGVCEGNIQERELSIHQGTAWPWLISFFVEGYLKIHRRGGMSFVKKIIEGFEEEMTENCIGTIPEMYNGNPPHKGKGATSQAWSVAALIHANKLFENCEEKFTKV